MKRLAVTVAVLLSTAAPSAWSRPSTTAPGVVYTIKVVVTDSVIRFGRDKFTHNGTPKYPRGALVHYAIANAGTRPYIFRVWGAQTGIIGPGRHDSILINWSRRGSYSYSTLYRNKPAGPKGTIVVF